jgi:hypothetical protein
MIRWLGRDAVVKRPADIATRVARRAYQLYEKRGRQEGKAVQDWDQAERELKKGEFRKKG